LSLLDALLPVYGDVLESLGRRREPTWVQLDEPSLALDRTDAERAAYLRAYKYLASRAGKLQLLVRDLFCRPQRQSFHGARASGAGAARRSGPRARAARSVARRLAERSRAVGGCDRRTKRVWRSRPREAGRVGRGARRAKVGKDRLWVAPSCSSCIRRSISISETKLDPELKSWLAHSPSRSFKKSSHSRSVTGRRREQQPGREVTARLQADQQMPR